MLGFGYIVDALSRKGTGNAPEKLTIGRVVDTNDPQQMGRVRAYCPSLGDKEQYPIKQIPWSIYVSPLGGMVSMGTRGPDKNEVLGPTAYGMWGIPKVGAYVLVGCIDGDDGLRFYSGCIHPQYLTHTMPHGRFTWGDQDDATKLPDGPFDTNERQINPLYQNLTAHFTLPSGGTHRSDTPSNPRANLEWRTRAVDNQVSAIAPIHVNHDRDAPGSGVADHRYSDFQFTTVTEEDGKDRIIRGPGYGVDQLEPDDQYQNTGGVNYDSMIYSWTTPGFHSMSMDDRHENSRIRIRTAAGHQILMDDTNERIYINTAGGESWIEIDEVGNIDIYASKNISTHAGGDINFSCDKTFRVKAKQGIHLQTDDQFRLHALKDLHVKSNQNIRMNSVQSTFIESDQDFHVKSNGTLYLTGQSQVHVRAVSSGIIQTGQTIDLNGPVATIATQASEKEAFWTSRVPEHEPWHRVFMNNNADKDSGNSHTPEYPYTSQDVGKGSAARGETYNRNPLWHR